MLQKAGRRKERGKWKKKLGNLSRPPASSQREPGLKLRQSLTQQKTEEVKGNAFPTEVERECLLIPQFNFPIDFATYRLIYRTILVNKMYPFLYEIIIKYKVKES